MFHDYVIGVRRVAAAALMVATLLVAGCGGGGGGGTPAATTPMSVTINWPDRGRAVTAPSSALSAKIIIRAAQPNKTNIEFTANRGTNDAAHSQTYTSTQVGIPGNRTIDMRFFAQANATGAVVAESTFTAQVSATGQVDATVVVDSRIHEVAVQTGQQVMLNTKKRLVATAYDDRHRVVAIEPDAFKWAVTAGAEHLRFVDGEAEGLLVGTAEVTASVDQITSPAVAVSVTPNGQVVRLDPTGRTVFWSLSGDGRVAGGSTLNETLTAYAPSRWNQAGGMQLFDYQPVAGSSGGAYSTNGTTYVGGVITAGHWRAWRSNGGSLEFLHPTVEGASLQLVDISADGSVAIGNQSSDSVMWRACTVAPGQGPVLLDMLPNATQCRAIGISDDGTRIAGMMEVSGQQGSVLWVNGTPQLLPTIDGSPSVPECISGDGTVVFGTLGFNASRTGHYRWSATTGIQAIEYPITAEVEGTTRTGDIAVGHDWAWSTTHGLDSLLNYVARVYGLNVTPEEVDGGVALSSDGKKLLISRGTLIRPLVE